MRWLCPASAISKGSIISSINSARLNEVMVRLSAPASTRDKSSRKVMRSASLCVWFSMASIFDGVGSTTPSARFSSIACRADTGVRNSWLTLAINSRRM